MVFQELSIQGVFKISLNPVSDNRGWFNRLYCKEMFANAGIDFSITQINHSFTKMKGSFRGIHYQIAPFSEYKLITCISGAVLDFGVDLRKNSDTLFQSISVELSESNQQALLLPPGVGHAFQTLEDNTGLLYLHSSFYNKHYEGGIPYNDPKINLNLPLEIADISERDRKHPLIETNFQGIEYEV